MNKEKIEEKVEKKILFKEKKKTNKPKPMREIERFKSNKKTHTFFQSEQNKLKPEEEKDYK